MNKAKQAEQLGRVYLNRSFFCRVILVVMTGFLFSVSVLGEELSIDDGELANYAQFLYQNGEYYRAITEYKRLSYFFPESPWVASSKIQIGRSYMAGGQLSEAITYWRSILSEKEVKEEAQSGIRILLGLSLLDYGQSKPYRLRLKNVTQAIETFEQLDHQLTASEQINGFLSDWNNQPPLEDKCPWLAGSMSALLPGSGSFYAGRKVEGTYAFFITALFMLATADSIKNDHQELGALFGFFSIAFYGGNIYTAVNSVHKYNDEMDSSRLYDLRKKHGIWFIPQTNQQAGQF